MGCKGWTPEQFRRDLPHSPRQSHLESCPFPFLGGDAEFPLQKLGQDLDKAQTEAGTLDELVHLVEAVVDVGEGGLGDAFAGVVKDWPSFFCFQG